jgi:hypothetical protein
MEKEEKQKIQCSEALNQLEEVLRKHYSKSCYLSKRVIQKEMGKEKIGRRMKFSKS